MRQVSTLK